jgi:glyoxylase-like metal-dependent hydrolase (beta-lactamase superfamily II)
MHVLAIDASGDASRTRAGVGSMRRPIVVAAGIAGALAIALAELRARRRATAAEPSEIAPGVFCLGPWGRTQTNVYLVRAGSSWVLVDAGWAQDAARIQAGVRRVLGSGVIPSAILLTHIHPDHAGSARALAQAWRCPIVIHPAERPFAVGDVEAMRRDAGPLDRWIILPVMRAIGTRRREALLARGHLTGLIQELEAGGMIPGVDGWTWLATPGHTRGHVAFMRAADRVILTGDAVVTLQVNTVGGLIGRQGLSGPPWYTTWDAGAAVSSIAVVAEVQPAVIAGGHGRPMCGPDTAALVRVFAGRAGAGHALPMR